MLTNGKTSLCVTTTGCIDCFVDVCMIKDYFVEKYHFIINDDFRSADIIIILGCAATQYTEEDSRLFINYVENSKREDALLIVSGCIAKVYPDFGKVDDQSHPYIEDIAQVMSNSRMKNDIVLYGNYDFQNINFKRAKKIRKASLFDSGLKNKYSIVNNIFMPFKQCGFFMFNALTDFIFNSISCYNKKTAILRCCLGCLNNCSYCSIKKSRGRVKSKSIETIMEEFKDILNSGYTDIVLTGTNLGDYGKDISIDLINLLDEMVKIDGDYRLRLRDVHPNWVIKNINKFMEILNSGKIVYILSPIQSGNNRILKLMNRGYRSEDIINCMEKIKRTYPRIVLETHLLIGFPGETESEFLDSYRIIDRKVFDKIRINRYTDRPGTKSAAMMPKTPELAIIKRYKKTLIRELLDQPCKKARAMYLLRSR